MEMNIDIIFQYLSIALQKFGIPIYRSFTKLPISRNIIRSIEIIRYSAANSR